MKSAFSSVSLYFLFLITEDGSSLVLFAAATLRFAIALCYRRLFAGAHCCICHCGLIFRPRSVKNLNKVAQDKAPERPEHQKDDCTDPEEEDVLRQRLGDHRKVELEDDEQLGDDDADQHPRLAANLFALAGGKWIRKF